MRIRTKLSLLLTSIALAPPLIVGAFAYRSARQSIEQSLGQFFELQATQSIGALDRELLGLYQTAQAWTGLELMQDVLSDDIDGRLAAFLIEQGRRNPLIERAIIIDPKGLVVAANRPVWIGQNDGGAPALPLREDYPCHDGGEASHPLLTCQFVLRAAFDETREIGRLSVSWNVADLTPPNLLRAAPAQSRGTLLFFRQDGLLVFSRPGPEQEMAGRNLVAAPFRAGSEGSGVRIERLGEKEYLVGYAHSRGASGWSALVVEDVAAAFAPASELRRLVLGLGGLAALGTFLLSVALARRVTRPLLEIEEGARRVAGGDLGTNIVPQSKDEFGALAKSFAQMVKDLARQREQLVDKDYVESILFNMIDGLILVDDSGRVLRVNRALVEMMASREERLLGRPAGSLFHDGFKAFEERVLEVALRGEPAREVELELAAESGKRLPVTVSAGVIPGKNDAPRSVVCIATDISQRKQGEHALVAAREIAEAGGQAKAQFLATISHEIRTPLNGIIGTMEMLASSRLSGEQRQYAETAQRSGELLLAVLNDVLDFSKIDSGRLDLETIDFDPRSSVETVGDILSLKAHDKGLELCVLVAPDLPERVRGDPTRLRQVLLNLGSNAVKFTAKGSVVIRAERGEAGRCRFSVTDTGIGIPEPLQDRLFKPFSQLEASTTRTHGGTGLGLAIARQLVDLMGGEIGFTSEENRGSTFFFEIPLPEVEVQAVQGQEQGRGLAGLRVLSIDDNATNRFVVGEMLRSWNCVVDEAADAWEGLEKLRGVALGPREFQLALVDFQMPEMDGGQLAQEIKSDPRLQKIPLILLTSMPQHGDAAQTSKLGFSAYLTKPIRRAVLHDTIVAVLGLGDAPGQPQLKLVTAHYLSERASAKRRILVVADSLALRQATVRGLEDSGYACDVAGDGDEALRAVARVAYDLVFLDWSLPGMGGDGVAREIRRQGQGRDGATLIAMTREPGATMWREAGMDDFVPSPPSREELSRIAERYAPRSPAAARGGSPQAE